MASAAGTGWFLAQAGFGLGRFCSGRLLAQAVPGPGHFLAQAGFGLGQILLRPFSGPGWLWPRLDFA